MASFQETLHYLRKDISGEADRALQSAVTAAWLGLSVKSLTAVSGRNGTVDYIHPVSGNIVANYAVQRERTETKPGSFGYRVYAPEGHVASIIKGGFAKLSATESLPYVTEIKDFFAPSAHRSRSRAERDEDIKRRIAKNRHEVRQAKHYQWELCATENQNLQHQKWQKGFVLRSTISHATANGYHSNGFANHSADLPANEHAQEKHHLTAPKGRTRRERTYKAVSAENRLHTKVEPGKFALENRSTKDRINNTDGSYTVLQFAGGTYAATQYTPDGGRIRLTTYNDEGEALKELGATSRSMTPRKLNRPYPLGRFIKSRLRAAATDADIVFELDDVPTRVHGVHNLNM